MSALSDLQGAVAKLSADVATEIADVVQAIKDSQASNAGAVAAVDAEAIVASLNDIDTTVNAETASFTPPVVSTNTSS